MMRRSLLAAACLLGASCAPTNQPMAVAEAQCMQYALNNGGGLTVGMSTGTGNWNDDSWGRGRGYNSSGVGIGVSVATEIPTERSPAKVYAACVQRRTGQPPVTPFNQRPELLG